MTLIVSAAVQPEREPAALTALAICQQIAPELDNEAYASLIVNLGIFLVNHLHTHNPDLLAQHLELERIGAYRRQMLASGYSPCHLHPQGTA